MADRSLSAHLALLAFFSFSSLFCFYKSRRLRNQRLSSLPPPNPKPNRNGKLFFASETGTSEALARRLLGLLSSNGLTFDLVDPKSYEPEDLQKESLVLIVSSTWEDGKLPPNAEFLARWLSESAEDFRVGSMLLAGCKFAVFGVGSMSYGKRFNAAAKDFSKWMRALGALELLPVGKGDVDNGDVDEVFGAWSTDVINFLKSGPGSKTGSLDSRVENDRDEVSDEEDDEGEEEDGEEEEEGDGESSVVDLEDIAGKGPTRKSPVTSANGEANGPREMVTPIIRTSLEKQVFS